MNLFPARPRPRPETPEQTATVDTKAMKKMAAELTAALDFVPGWWRSDRGSFVSAGRADGSATLVGNSAGWWVVLPGPGDKQIPQKAVSARAALALSSGPVDLTKPKRARR